MEKALTPFSSVICVGANSCRYKLSGAGSAAFFANEGLALYIVENVLKKCPDVSSVALLGMAFKGDNDDIRSSLSYRVKKAFLLGGVKVTAADLHVKNDENLVEESIAIASSEVVVICTPHTEYKSLDYQNKPVVDVWNLLGNGSLILGSEND